MPEGNVNTSSSTTTTTATQLPGVDMSKVIPSSPTFIKENSHTPKKSAENTDSEKIARYSKSKYFQEKDRMAIEFLKKHPVPSKLLK